MKVRHFIAGCGVVGGILLAQNASAAVSYQKGSNLRFNFNPMLALTLSSDGFVIPNLMPGTSQDSNEVVATVYTNSAAGYTLTATVGNDTYNSTDLVSGANTIAMINTDTALTKGTWGYTLDGGNTYKALDTVEATILNKTTDTTGSAAVGYLGTDATGVKIGAYADDNQAGGNYRNVMNFAVVANQLPAIIYVETLQEFATMAPERKAEVIDSMEIERPYNLKDVRDEKVYTVAKLRDGKVWMTSNLNLAGGTALYSETSNVPSGYSSSGNIPYYTLPESRMYIFTDDDGEYVYNTNNSDCTGSWPCDSYYSWLVATAGGKNEDGDTVTTDGVDTPYSICPKGWRLPKSGNFDDDSETSLTGYKKGDFYKLAMAYNLELDEGSYGNNLNVYGEGGIGVAANLPFTGYFYNTSPYSSGFYSGGTEGWYWSSSSRNSTQAYEFHYTSSFVVIASSSARRAGISARCILE